MPIKPVFRDYSPRAVDPAVALFLPPPFVHALETLWFELMSALDSAIAGSVIYSRPFELERTNNYLGETAKALFRRNAAVAFWFDWSETKGGIKIQPGEAGRLETIHPEWMFVDGRGKNYSLAELRHHSPLWSGGRRDLEKGVIHLGHAGILINHQSRILIDPVFCDHLVPGSVGQVDAIVFTHAHSDHFDLESILSFGRETPIYLPEQSGAPFEPNLVELLKAMNFSAVKPVSPGERIQLVDGAKLDFLPFFGEASELAGFCGQCVLYTGHGRRILFHADASPNSAGNSILQSRELDKCLREDGAIDTVFGTWWQKRVFLLQLTPLMLVRPFSSFDWLTRVENCDCPVAFTLGLLHRTGATKFVTYAERGEDAFNPPDLQSSYIQRESYYWRPYQDYARTLEAESGASVCPAEPLQAY